MDILDFKNTYWSYYLQIEHDFFSINPYCAIDQSNNNSFSVKYLHLHLSICSEIDTICKTLCKELSDELVLSKCGITDYIKILNRSYPTFFNEVVSLIGYKYNDVQPWKSIKNNHVPNWWNIYNDIKHHRDQIKNNKENYKYANQKNIIEALCALYVLIQYWAAKNFVTDKEEEHNSVMTSFKSKALHLVNWEFYFDFMGQGEWFSSKSYFKYKAKEVSCDE